MFYALNKDGIRIDAYEADKNEQYTCPICNNRVILKRGSVNIDHFAHEANVCEDTWNYDMSEWHKRMQNYFPRESQEVVVSHKGRKHRADVLIGDMMPMPAMYGLQLIQREIMSLLKTMEKE